MSADHARRCNPDRLTPIERALFDAMLEVDGVAVDTRLSKAVWALSNARRLVADFIDGVPDLPEPSVVEQILGLLKSRTLTEKEARAILDAVRNAPWKMANADNALPEDARLDERSQCAEIAQGAARMTECVIPVRIDISFGRASEDNRPARLSDLKVLRDQFAAKLHHLG